MSAWVKKKIMHLPMEMRKIWVTEETPMIRKTAVRRLRDDSRPTSSIGSPEIQELDGGFFEKFGSLLKEHQEDGDKAVSPTEEGALEPATQPLEQPSDSEEEPEDLDQNELITELTDAMGWNIEELYSEVLYEIVHIVGGDFAEDDSSRSALFSYLQQAFKFDDEKHNDLLERAKAKEAPNILLSVEVIEAKGLRSKDANGLSDPFCTLYLTSETTHRFNTSVKSETLNPSWEEHFSLPVQNPAEDVICIEVWDFDPAETVREKMSKIGDAKGIKGLRRLMKEIAVTASTGKHNNELIGCVQMPLRGIPATGQYYWLSLEKKTKAKIQGEVKVRLAFSSEKNSQVASQEHRHLLRLMLMHELEENKVETFQWCGPLPSPAEAILTQHLVQCGLTPVDVALAQWIEYATVHADHSLSFTVFAQLLEKLTKPLINGLIADDEEKLFWDTTKKLLPSCMNAIRKIRKLTPSDRNGLKQLSAVLSILSQLQTLQVPEGMSLFSPSVYGWLSTASDDPPNCDINATFEEAIKQGTIDWLAHILENNGTTDNSDEGKLTQLIKVIQLVRSDLQRAIEFHDKIFAENFNFPYARTLYLIYQSRISELVEPVVNDVCRTLKPLRFNDNPGDGIYDNDPLTMGTKLFEVYLIMQRLSVLGIGLCPGEIETLKITNFHTWFHRGVAQWLDIALYKALQRIQKAVDIDQLNPVDSSVKYSSSAVDTLAIFYQIKIFWKQLAWPDVEGSYTFVAKIIDDICRCSVFYADTMSKRVDGMGVTENAYQKKFEVTNEWCLAINNIDYVRQSILPFIEELGMEEIVTALANFRSQTEADHCKRTLQLVIDNAVDTVGNKIIELLETVAAKMTPVISRFLMEGAELINQDNNHVDRLMKYLDDNLLTLHSELNSDNFDRILAIIWEKLSQIIYELVEHNLEKRRPPSFFANLHETLKLLMGFFKQGGQQQQTTETDFVVLDKIEHLLMLHGSETGELIHQYHLERVTEQKESTNATLGLLTVRAQFVGDVIRVEIMNARNIHPADSNGSCDPYVKIHFLPEEKYVGAVKPKTKTHKKNLFPLFDETFTINFTPEQRQVKDAMIMFNVKDQDFLGNEFIAEAFLLFADIPETEMTTGLEELEQVHLKLSRPTKHDSEALKALEHRVGDKLAKDFVKRQKAKFAAH